MFDELFYTKNAQIDLSAALNLLSKRGLKIQTEVENGLIKDVSTLDKATENTLSFLDNKKYLNQLKNTKASFCFVKKEFEEFAPKDTIALVTNNPYLAFAIVADYFYKPKVSLNKNLISSDAKIGQGTFIGPNTYVAENVEIGKNCQIHSGCYIGQGVKIGNNVIINSNCSITFAVIENNVIIHSGVKIGQDGFGFANSGGKNIKVPQLGRVLIEDDVEIGANTCIDRGSFNDTKIGQGVKIDNLVQVAHNVEIGNNSIIVAQVAIAGSVKIGQNVVVAGQAAIAGHLTIGSFSQIGGQAGVIGDLPSNSKVTGTPAEPINQLYKRIIKLKKIAKDYDKK